MAVAISGDRKGVEITWDASGGAAPPEVNVPEFPTHPIVGDPSAPPSDAHPEHPIYLPPFIWGPDDPRPSQPIELPPEIADGVDDEEIKQKILDFALGNLPPYGGGPAYPAPVSGGQATAVQVFGQGQEGDWSNTPVMPNDGRCSLSYPVGFVGESYIEVRALDGTLVDSGTISVG